MNYLHLLFTLLTFIFLPTLASSQLSSIEIGISFTENGDTKYDQEYEYAFARSAAIYHLTIGGQFEISSKFSLTTKVAYSWNLQRYAKPGFASGTIKDMTVITKEKTLEFFKSGVALSYWIINSGKGFFLEGELQGLFNLSAISEERIVIGGFEAYDIDFKEEVRSFVPSLRLGFGYRLGLTKKLSIYIMAGKEIMASSIYTKRDEFQLINNIADLKINYKI